MLECHWKKTFGIECIGCGFQQSLLALLEGDFLISLSLYPATIPLLLTFAYTVAHILFKYKKGARNIVILFSSTVFIMVASYIYRLISQ